MRTVLRLAEKLPEDDTPQKLEDTRKQFDKWVAPLEKRRPARGPSRDSREAINVILKHIDKNGKNF